ncbi:hypothetical protein [Geitlerinema sp. PCC 9228]|uniref:hypothetical protein n=1 Tax=Geitlerinema sp. PCC 9228 TaxID=111611 RepID=UPI0011148604|nr:hypothetical protein [Geitlerinema sp. PCC 9228]
MPVFRSIHHICLLAFLGGSFWLSPTAIAQPSDGDNFPKYPTPLVIPSLEPPNFEPLQAGETNQDRSLRTIDDISREGLTPPSLWWSREQLQYQVLENWIVSPETQQVDLLVNRQVWSFMKYLARYQFVNRMGTAAQDFGYNIRVFNRQQDLLAVYNCSTGGDFCRVWIDTAGKGGSLRGSGGFDF